MKRNLRKAAEEGRAIVAKHEGLDLTIPEVYELKQENEDQACNAIMNAFYIGLAVGYRNGGKNA